MTDYSVRIDNVPQNVPVDVVLEHLGYCMRGLLKDRHVNYTNVRIHLEKVHGATFTSADPGAAYPSQTVCNLEARTGRQHPFDGPEMFDDVETTTTFLPTTDKVISDVFTAISHDFPYLTELFNTKRAEREERTVKRPTTTTEPAPEGEWDLDKGDEVGSD